MLLLPILVMMMSGVIEFGFMLNYYLDLIDAARESARFAANDDPLHDAAGNYVDPNIAFYARAQAVALQSIDIGSGGQIEIRDPVLFPASKDDIVISAFAVADGIIHQRYPFGAGEDGHVLNNRQVSKFSNAEIEALLDVNAPNTGIVLVEIYYEYEMVLGLPWITVFVPENILLHAYSIMPNVFVEPTPTPSS